jgi:UDP-glucose-4-epimerase GalE
MKPILVTGGAGYIGSHTLHMLRGRGHAAVCLDNLSTGFRRFVGEIPFIHADLAHTPEVEAAFAEYDFGAVIHFAAHALVEESYRNPHKYYHDNILNCLNLLEAMRRHAVPHLVFSSTCATYGIPGRVPITEDFPLNPVNPYGVTKMVIERILRDYENAHGIRSVALRYFNAAGADPEGALGEWHRPESHLIPRLFDTAMGTEAAAQIYGNDYPTRDGTCIRDYIHVVDLAHAHAAALEYLFAGSPSTVLNLGTGQGYSVLEVVNQVKATTGIDFPIDMKPRRPGDPPELVADATKACTALGWQARHSSLQEIIETAWRWHRTRHQHV